MGRVHQLRRGRLVFDVDDAGDGVPVVLLHGFPQDRRSWHHVAPHLHRAGLRTLALDQRGYSPGARPARRGAYRLPWLVADVLALLDAAGLEQAHLVGHDWGGNVGWATAAAAPERVASLTAVSTPHPAALGRALTSPAQVLSLAYVGFFQLPALPEAVLGRRLERALRGTGLPAVDAAHHAARMREPGALRAALNWYRALPLAGRGVGPVRVPTTYVWGNRDFALHRRAAELTADHVLAPYRFVELDAGHWLLEHEPAALARAVIARAEPGDAGGPAPGAE